jgi:hypothetical protein
MERRFRRGFTAAEKTELWDGWQRGESLKAIGRAFGKATRLLTLNNDSTISIFVLRCLRTNCGLLQWNLRCRRKFRSEMIVAIRMDNTNENVLDYLLLPGLKFSVLLTSRRFSPNEM